MAGNGSIFKRVEKKYMLTPGQYEEFLKAIEPHMLPDAYGLSKICNIYFDTENDELVRLSNEKPVYKEKLRLRSYGIPGADDKVYLELKKKYKDIVYKRRISLTLSEAEDYLLRGIRPKKDSQILREIDYFIVFHKTVPKLYLAYDRTAWYGREDGEFRMTFDSHIRSRRDHLSLAFGDAADELFEQAYWLLEIKSAGAYPLWLVKKMGELSLYPISFSKYGTIYKKEVAAGMAGRALDYQGNMRFLDQQENKIKGEKNYVYQYN